MANLVYNSFKGNMDGGIDWDDAGVTVKVMLVTSSYTPDKAHDFLNDITDEVTGTGYTAGGVELINRSITIDGANDLGVYDGDDVTWASSTITARGAVLYKDTGNSATAPLIGYIDFASDKSSTNGDFTIQWSGNGIFTIA